MKDTSDATYPNSTYTSHIWVRLYNGSTLVTQVNPTSTAGNYSITNVTNGINYTLQIYTNLGTATICTPSPYPVSIPSSQPGNATQNFGFRL